MFKAMGWAVKEKGAKSLLTGWVGVQYRQMTWGAGYFCSIGPFKKMAAAALSPVMLKEGEKTNPGYEVGCNLVSGFAAGVFGACFNCPGDTVRSVVMKRTFAAGGDAVAPEFFAVAREIVKEKGVASLYSGFGFKAMHLGGGGALMALLVPKVKGAIDERGWLQASGK